VFQIVLMDIMVMKKLEFVLNVSRDVLFANISKMLIVLEKSTIMSVVLNVLNHYI
jgi:hypothetical protein